MCLYQLQQQQRNQLVNYKTLHKCHISVKLKEKETWKDWREERKGSKGVIKISKIKKTKINVAYQNHSVAWCTF